MSSAPHVVVMVLDDETLLAWARAMSEHVKRSQREGVVPSEPVVRLAEAAVRTYLERTASPAEVIDVQRQPRDLLTLPEVAERLGVSVRTVERLTASGRLPSVRIDRARRVRVGDFDGYVAGLRSDRKRQEPTGADSPSRIRAVR